MNYGKMEQMLRALIRADLDAFEVLGRQLQSEKWPDAPAFGTATFYVAANRRFAHNQPVGDIIDYVGQLRSTLPANDDLDPRAAEHLIRLAVRDEDLSIDEFPAGQQVHAQQMVIYDIMSQENLSDDELDAFFAEVRQILGDSAPAQ